jgi:hypothetical protein
MSSKVFDGAEKMLVTRCHWVRPGAAGAVSAAVCTSRSFMCPPRKSASPIHSAFACPVQGGFFQVKEPLDRSGFGLLQLESCCKPVLALAAIVPLNDLQSAIKFC